MAVERCKECGFAYELDEADAAGASIVREANKLAQLLIQAASPRTRRHEGTWSPLEYTAHVRDVLLVQRERVLTARLIDRPTFHPMGRDERVDFDGYSEQVIEDVARQLGDAARLFANVLARLSPADWDRTVMYNYPDRMERSLRWVAVHTWHEVEHHGLDVARQAM